MPGLRSDRYSRPPTLKFEIAVWDSQERKDAIMQAVRNAIEHRVAFYGNCRSSVTMSPNGHIGTITLDPKENIR